MNASFYNKHRLADILTRFANMMWEQRHGGQARSYRGIDERDLSVDE